MFSLILFITGCASSQKDDYEHKMDKILQQNEELKQQTAEEMRASKELPFVMFEFDSTKLPLDSYDILDKIAEIMIRNRALKLSVEGNSDIISSKEYNDWLSNKRTSAVKSYLVGKGVHPDSIKTYGNGERKPLIDLITVEARQLNRRVDLIITTRNWESIF